MSSCGHFAESFLSRAISTLRQTALPAIAEFHQDCRRALAIDDQKVALRIERQQKVMPDALGVIDALIAVGEERAHLAHIEVAGRGNHHQIGTRVERNESLTAQGVTLHHFNRNRRQRCRAKDTDTSASALRIDIDAGEVMIALGESLIDVQHARGGLDINGIAEGRKLCRRQRLSLDCSHTLAAIWLLLFKPGAKSGAFVAGHAGLISQRHDVTFDGLQKNRVGIGADVIEALQNQIALGR